MLVFVEGLYVRVGLAQSWACCDETSPETTLIERSAARRPLARMPVVTAEASNEPKAHGEGILIVR